MNQERDRLEALSSIAVIQTRLKAIDAYAEDLFVRLADPSLSWSTVLMHVEDLYHALDPAIKQARTNSR